MHWVSLHSHTTFSYGDGYGRVEEHVKRVADLGMSALALTEHGNVNSHVALEKSCREHGIKPIYGLEAYYGGVDDNKTRQKNHLTLIAENEEGYRNLNKIVTRSYIDAYQWPTVSPESLKKHARGLICLSGCSDSLVSCTLLGGKSSGEKRESFTEDQLGEVRRKIEWFRDVFEDKFFLEVQRFPQLARTCTLNATFAKLAEITGVPLAGTADVHYPYPGQNEIQKLLHAARRGSTVEATGAAWEYDIQLTYPETDREILRDLMATGLDKKEATEAIINTERIAQKCNVELPKAAPLRFPTPPGEGPSFLYLKKKIKEGVARRREARPDLIESWTSRGYGKRINHELKIIMDKDFCDYFLVVADLIQRAKSKGIVVGPGRGSAAGSVICYMLGVTEVDPLHPAFDKAIFERFIDPNRSDMPDIDVDFDDERRNEVAEMAREIYGGENVANVGNHTKYRGKKSLQDVARAYGLGQRTFDAIGNKCIIRTETDERANDSILDAIESFNDDESVRSLVFAHGDKLQQAIQLEGNQHSMGIHAGGFVISSEPIPEVCAVYTKEKANGNIAQVIPYDKRDAEYLGMLKMDFLGLSTCGVIAKELHWTGVDLEGLYGLFYTDYDRGGVATLEIMKAFRNDDLVGIFQFEGGTTRQLCKRVQPETFDHLAAINALSRPGPFYGGQADEYVRVKNGEKDWDRIHEFGFDRHVEWTYGQIVYQEQIMFILRDLAGFDMPTVLRVRKIIGKKLGEHQFAELWSQFLSGCIENGLDENRASRVWSSITTAAGYAFNVAHAYSYSLIAWWQMWFKTNYPTVFFGAALAKNGDGKNDIPRRTLLLRDTIKHKVNVAPVRAAGMKKTWSIGGFKGSNNAIFPGFMQLPGIGEATAQAMSEFVYEWESDHYNGEGDVAEIDFPDFLAMPGVGEKTIMSMLEFSIKEDPFKIDFLKHQLGGFRQQHRSGQFRGTGIPATGDFVRSRSMREGMWAYVGLVRNVFYSDEIERIREKTGKSVDEIKAELKSPEKSKKVTIFTEDEGGEVALRVSRWKYDELSSIVAGIKPDEHVVVAWGKIYDRESRSMQVDSLWVFDVD